MIVLLTRSLTRLKETSLTKQLAQKHYNYDFGLILVQPKMLYGNEAKKEAELCRIRWELLTRYEKFRLSRTGNKFQPLRLDYLASNVIKRQLYAVATVKHMTLEVNEGCKVYFTPKEFYNEHYKFLNMTTADTVERVVQMSKSGLIPKSNF